MPEGDHVLRAEKLSESWEDAIFGGVYAEAGQPVEGPGRVIEVYGDSDAVGYGARSETRDCPGEGVFLNTDTNLAFPALVARRFGADLDLVARSGIGLIRDFSPAGTGGRMIDVANRAAIADGAALPVEGERITVVALGANDFDMDLRATNRGPTKRRWSRILPQPCGTSRGSRFGRAVKWFWWLSALPETNWSLPIWRPLTGFGRMGLGPNWWWCPN